MVLLIDMNREEMKYLCISLEDKTVNGMIHSKELEGQFEQYANQRVIEALEDVCNDEETEYIRHRIKELKQ